MQDKRRWYDNDTILKEALELLRIQPDEKQIEACDFLINLQEEVAKEVIDHISEIVHEYSKAGSRWYDKDPTMLRAMELLRHSNPRTQRIAALKLLLALERQAFDENE